MRRATAQPKTKFLSILKSGANLGEEYGCCTAQTQIRELYFILGCGRHAADFPV
jgi:hypothetical protein